MKTPEEWYEEYRHDWKRSRSSFEKFISLVQQDVTTRVVLDVLKEHGEPGLPFAIEFDDYHDIDWFVDDINRNVNKGPRLKGIEVAFVPNGNYIGLFYIGRKPSEKRIKKIVEETTGFTDEEDEIEWSN